MFHGPSDQTVTILLKLMRYYWVNRPYCSDGPRQDGPFSVVKYTDGSRVWSDGPRNKYGAGFNVGTRVDFWHQVTSMVWKCHQYHLRPVSDGGRPFETNTTYKEYGTKNCEFNLGFQTFSILVQSCQNTSNIMWSIISLDLVF